MAVRAVTNNCLNCLSANEFDCDAFGAMWIAAVPLLSKNAFRFYALCSMGPSVWRRFALFSHNLWIFASDLMIDFLASLLAFINCTSVHPVLASVSIWMSLLPSVSSLVNGPVVADDTASNSAYLFCCFCMKDALVSLPAVQGRHDSFCLSRSFIPSVA